MLERPACILAVVSAAKMSRNGYRQLPGRHVRKASRYVLAIYFNSGMSFGHARKVSMYPRCCVSTAKMSSDGCKEFRRAGETEVFGHVRKASRYALAILHFTTASIFIVWTCSKGRHVSTLLCFNSEDVQKWHQRLRGTQFYTGRRDRGVWACWQWRAGMSLLYCISTARMSIVCTCSKGRHVSSLLCFNSEDVQKWHRRLQGTFLAHECSILHAKASIFVFAIYCISTARMVPMAARNVPCAQKRVLGHARHLENVQFTRITCTFWRPALSKVFYPLAEAVQV